jgi:hypothetical protein
VRLDRYGREKSCADLAGELSEIGINISATTIWRILKNAGLRKTKPTRKPGLTKKMKADRLAWCLEHQHWTLEDFKNVIWSDETSVVLDVVDIESGGQKMKLSFDLVFVSDGKVLVNLCFGAALHTIKKAPITVGNPRLRKRNVILSKKSSN